MLPLPGFLRSQRLIGIFLPDRHLLHSKCPFHSTLLGLPSLLPVVVACLVVSSPFHGGAVEQMPKTWRRSELLSCSDLASMKAVLAFGHASISPAMVPYQVFVTSFHILQLRVP